ncbi:MAG: MaoC/PaaZ C-terminal domain-containing protein [Myxococcales bacterium]|nr:MaoC/PaaZ C-terminal domain-containing protein [Myxococcales bacterium]
MVAISNRHLLQQGPVLGALGRTVAGALRQRFEATQTTQKAPPLPGPEFLIEAAAPSAELRDDYVRYLGGDPRAYRGQVPPHLFPQFCLPALARTLEGVPYPLLQVVNGGCRLERLAPLPADQPIRIRARLEGIDDNGRRAVFHQRAIVGAGDVDEALRIDCYPIVVLRGAARREAPASAKPTAEAELPARVPQGSRELCRRRLGKGAGLDYAKLTGDFNPIHWIKPYARSAGFASVILHGFASFAFAFEGLSTQLLGGDAARLRSLDVKFTRPLPLPREVGLFTRGSDNGEHGRARGQVFLADAELAPPYLAGHFTLGALP